MENPATGWQLMVMLIQQLPIEFWRVILTLIGAAYSLGNDDQPFYVKARTIFYGTVFGYFTCDALFIAFGLPKFLTLLFAVSGIGGNWLAGIVLDAFKELKQRWRELMPYAWAEIKEHLPIKTLLNAFINRMNKPKP